MAATVRVFADLVSGVTDTQLLVGGDTISGAFIADLPAIADPNFIELTIDPELEAGDPEVVWVTAHTALATTATILREQAGTTARQHESGTKVVAGLTSGAIQGLYDDIETAITDLETSNDDLETAMTTLVNGTVDDLNAATTALNNAVAATEDVTPTGVVVPFAGSAAPGGWLLCDGAAVSRTTYATLFGVIGTTFGVGDGSTTFNLPDMRQRFPLGKADAGTGATLGETGGAIDHTHTQPTHTHSGPSHTHTMGTHTHSISETTNNAGSHAHSNSTSGTASIGSDTTGRGLIDASDINHSHTWSDTSSSGGSHSHSDGTSSTTQTTSGHLHGVSSGSTGSSGSHSHAVSGTTSLFSHPVLASNHTHSVSSTGSTGSHSHSVSGTSGATDPGDTNASGTGATGASGGDVTGVANPPYMALNYIIRSGI